MPKLIELYGKYKDQGLVVIGIHDEGEHEKMEAFVKEKAMPYPCVADVSGATAEVFGVDGIPCAILIDRKGIVREIKSEDYEKTIPKLLEEKIQ